MPGSPYYSSLDEFVQRIPDIVHVKSIISLLISIIVFMLGWPLKYISLKVGFSKEASVS